jgi:hypothetical protein
MKGYGGVDVYLHIFLTSALVGGELYIYIYIKPHGNRVLRKVHCSLKSNVNKMYFTHGERRDMYKILVTEAEGRRRH